MTCIAEQSCYHFILAQDNIISNRNINLSRTQLKIRTKISNDNSICSWINRVTSPFLFWYTEKKLLRQNLTYSKSLVFNHYLKFKSLEKVKLKYSKNNTLQTHLLCQEDTFANPGTQELGNAAMNIMCCDTSFNHTLHTSNAPWAWQHGLTEIPMSKHTVSQDLHNSKWFKSCYAI